MYFEDPCEGPQGHEGGSHLVLRVFTGAAHGYPWASQTFFNAAIWLKRLSHPNIVPFIGATVDPLQLVMEWMPDRNLAEYLQEHPEANRICLVSPLLFASSDR